MAPHSEWTEETRRKRTGLVCLFPLMLFIYPMWDSESERIGLQKCTPTGYVLHGLAELLGFIALLSMLGITVYLVYRGVSGNFRCLLLWLIAVPLGIGMIGRVLWFTGIMLAAKRDFKYDADARVASWVEGGKALHYSTLTDASPEPPSEF